MQIFKNNLILSSFFILGSRPSNCQHSAALLQDTTFSRMPLLPLQGTLLPTLRRPPEARLLGVALRAQRLQPPHRQVALGKGRDMVELVPALVEAAVIRRQSIEVAVAVWVGALEPMAPGDQHALICRDGGTVGAWCLFE